MADTPISGLATLAGTALVAGDWFPAVDVSDTSMAASGTNKKVDAALLADVVTARSSVRYIGSAPTALADALAYAGGNVINVLAGGATGDGATDDATALAAIITAA